MAGAVEAVVVAVALGAARFDAEDGDALSFFGAAHGNEPPFGAGGGTAVGRVAGAEGGAFVCDVEGEELRAEDI